MKSCRLCLIAALALAGCALDSRATPGPTLPPIATSRDLLEAEGNAEPGQVVTLRAEDSSLVAEVWVAEGDSVGAGDPLLRLDDTDARLAVQKAEVALAAAQAQRDLARAGVRPEQLAILEAQLAGADAIVSQASAAVAVVQAGGTEADFAEAQAAVVAASESLQQATDSHNDTMQCFEVPTFEGGTEKICPTLGTYEEVTRAQMQAAQAAVVAAQAQLAAIQGPASGRVSEAQAELEVALAQRDTAQAQLDLARAGASPESLAVLEAAVHQVETALASARDRLDARTVAAPFAGVVTDLVVHPGDTTSPGSALITLATLSHLHIRTKDLSEMDIARITEGQPISATFDARPDLPLSGRVVSVERRGQDYQGTIVYPLFIELDSMPDWTRWGMTAYIQFHTSDSVGGAPTPAEAGPAGSVIAEATIEPRRWSELRYTLPGRIAEVLVEPGQAVQAGDVVARLDSLTVDAAVRQAEAALAEAQANLAQAQAGPRPEAIAVSAAQVDVAEAEIARATAARSQLPITLLQAQLAAVRARLETAQAERRQLLAQLQWAVDDSNNERAREVRRQIVVNDQQIAAENTRLAALPSLFSAQLEAADAGIRVAEAARDAAQAQLVLAQTGPRTEETAIAQAAVQQAEVALAQARATQARTVLRAPFSSTVTQVLVEPGDFVTHDRSVAILATLESMQATTTDLPETDIPLIVVGQAVTIRADAVPDQVYSGRVIRIDAQPILYRGGITYAAVIELAGDASALWWGMTVMAEFTD